MKRIGLTLVVMAGALAALAEDSAAPTFGDLAPYDYAVDCLISSGTQYIDTGLVISNDMEVLMDFEVTWVDPNATGIFGSRVDANTQNVDITFAGSVCSLDFANGPWSEYRSQFGTLTASTRYTMFLSRTNRWARLQDGTLASTPNAKACEGEWCTPTTAWIFGTAGSMQAAWDNARMALYSLVITQRGVPIRDYQPCVKDGEAGLYDRITKTFRGNAGEGEFSYFRKTQLVVTSSSATDAVVDVTLADLGVNAASCDLSAVCVVQKNAEPVIDYAVDYIQSDGTQCIDTHLVISNDMEVTIGFEVTDIVSGASGVFGARTSADSQNAAFSLFGENGQCQVCADFSNGSYSSYRVQGFVVANVPYVAQLGSNLRLVKSRTGTIVGQNDEPSQSGWCTPASALIFGTAGTTWQYAKMKLYYLTIKDKGVIIRDYQPCVKNGVAGLYERVSGTFAAQDCGNDFVAGPPIDDPMNGRVGGLVGLGTDDYAVTNRMTVTAAGEYAFEFSNLQPGSVYGYYLIADNGLPGGVARLPEDGYALLATGCETVPEGGSNSLAVKAGKCSAGKLMLTLARTQADTEATVYFLQSPTWGDCDTEAWKTCEPFAAFGVGELEKRVESPVIKSKSMYFRAFTSDGEWSRTHLKWTTDYKTPQGLFIVVR